MPHNKPIIKLGLFVVWILVLVTIVLDEYTVLHSEKENINVAVLYVLGSLLFFCATYSKSKNH